MERAYRVLALRYRPQRFKELVGQDLLCRILKNAFQMNRLASAFLLTGIRGVGKTTVARLLAKTMNCATPENTEEGVEACGVCPSCKAFEDGSHTDIIEFDAASYTGVDDIRRILEACQYSPLQGRFKVFIVDEVHMLSKSAFNAFLKTLESPPSHVKFILATTEVEKIPPTIISRCLRFDLARIDKKVIEGHLAALCEREDILYDAGALGLLAASAEGSLRCALSVLEQALLLAQTPFEKDAKQNTPSKDAAAEKTTPKVTVALARSVLGLKDNVLTQTILQAVINNDAKAALKAARTAYDAGGDPLMVFNQLSTLVHHLSCVLVGQMETDAVFEDAEKEMMSTLTKSIPLPLLGRLWQMLLKGQSELLSAPFPQRTLEMLLIRLCYASQLPAPESLFEPQPQEQVQEKPQAQPQEQVQEQSQSSQQTEALNQPATKTPLDATLEIANPEAPAVQPATENQTKAAFIKSTDDLFALLREKKEGLLHTHMHEDIEIVALDAEVAEPLLSVAVQKDTHFKPILKRLEAFLTNNTSQAWRLSVTEKEAVETLAHKAVAEKEALKARLSKNPSVEKARKVFPDLKVLDAKKQEAVTETHNKEDEIKEETGT